MRNRLTWLVLVSATITITALHHLGRALATTAEGYKSTLLAVGRFGEIDVSSSFPPLRLKTDRERNDSGCRCKRRRDCQTCTCKAMSGRPAETPAGTRTLGIA